MEWTLLPGGYTVIWSARPFKAPNFQDGVHRYFYSMTVKNEIHTNILYTSTGLKFFAEITQRFIVFNRA